MWPIVFQGNFLFQSVENENKYCQNDFTKNISFFYFSLDHQHGQDLNNPQWCEGAFPPDLEDVALSPTGNLKGGPSTAAASSSNNRAGGPGGCFEANSSSCSPPSVQGKSITLDGKN